MDDVMKRLSLLLLLLLFLIAACAPQQPTETLPSPSETPVRVPSAEPTPTATTTPPKTLTVCTAQLPGSLFPYDGSQIPIKRNLLSILYEGAIKTVNGSASSEILQRVPSLANGDLRLEPVPIQRGQTVVDAEGSLAVLKPGLRVRPSGCRSADCTVVWDGEEPLQMDRMVVDFKLRDDLTWSDGIPVTADESVFSFQLAYSPESPGQHWAEDRTETYRVLDPLTVQWIGRAGFSTSEISQFFWQPLPGHLFEGTEDWSELVNAEALAQLPLSYGSFQIQAREPDQLVLIPNPYFTSTNENLSMFDELVIRRIDGDRGSAFQALQSGECDVLDPSFGWENDLDLLSEINANESFSIWMETGKAWWQLVFGITPAAYDDFYNPNQGDRPDFFGDQLVRRAFAACLNREEMRARALGEWGLLWPSFLPPGASQISQEGSLSFNPEQAAADLQAAGWLDDDGNPETPRIAVNVPGVPTGTEFRVEMLVDETGFQQDMAGIIQASLAGCGIGVDIRTLSSEAIYAPGPEGPLFGRGFDLALIAWEPGPELDCRLYLDQAVPGEGNQWVGTNIGGLMQPDYDSACSSAGLALEENRDVLQGEAERAFLNLLPAIPLFSTPRISIVSSKLCDAESLTAGKGLLNDTESIMGDKNCP